MEILVTNNETKPERPAPVDLTPREKRLLQRLSTAAPATPPEFMEAVRSVKTVISGRTAELSMNSRVDEQELFAALVQRSATMLGKRPARATKQAFQTAREGLSDGTQNLALRLTRRALRTLVQDGTLPQRVARQIRRIALGQAQLDEDRTTLKTRREEGARETPLRALRTAFERYISGSSATADEHKAFKAFVRRDIRPAGGSRDPH